MATKVKQKEWPIFSAQTLRSKKPFRNYVAEIDLLTKQINNHPTDWLLYVFRFYRNGSEKNPNADYHASIRDCTKVIELRGDSFSASRSTNAMYYHARATYWYYLGEYSKAVADCSSAIGVEPGAHLFRLRGCGYSAMGKLNDAVEDLTRAIDFPGSNKFVYRQAIRDRKKVMSVMKRLKTSNTEDKSVILTWSC